MTDLPRRIRISPFEGTQAGIRQYGPIRVLLSAISLVLATFHPLSAAEVTLRLHHFLGPESVAQRLLIEPWARRIAAESNNRIAVEIYPEMKLGGKAPELLEQVASGAVDVIWTAAAYNPGAFPRTEVFTLPLVHERGATATNLAISELMETALKDDFSSVHPLLAHVHPGHLLFTGGKRITRFDDLSGLTLRAPGRGIGLWTVTALGAEPARKRHPKLARALARGRLDGVLMSPVLADSLEVTETATSLVFLGRDRRFGTSLYLFLMNAARYASLPADLKAVIDRNSGAALALRAGRAWQRVDATALRHARQSGAEMVFLTGPEEEKARRALGAVVGRWRSKAGKLGIDAPALLAAARAAIARNAEIDR